MRDWINLKKVLEKQYKGKSGIYKISVSGDHYIAGIAKRVDKKLASIINDILHNVDNEVTAFLKNCDPRCLIIEVFDESEQSLVFVKNSIIDLGLPTIQAEVKEKSVSESKPPFEHRINVNTVLQAYNKEQFDTLKKWYNVL